MGSWCSIDGRVSPVGAQKRWYLFLFIPQGNSFLVTAYLEEQEKGCSCRTLGFTHHLENHCCYTHVSKLISNKHAVRLSLV